MRRVLMSIWYELCSSMKKIKNMKKIIIISLSFILAISVNAQKEEKKQLTFGVLGNTGLFIYKYGLDKKYTKRITFGGAFSTGKSNSFQREFAGIKNLDKEIVSNISIGYGWQKNTNISDKINLFYALDFVLGTTYSTSLNGWEVTDSTLYALENSPGSIPFLPSTGDFSKDRISSFSYSGSFRPAIGFNVRLIEKLYAGVEYRLSIAQVKYNTGKTISESRTNEVETSNEFKIDDFVEFNSSLNGRTAVTLTYSF